MADIELGNLYELNKKLWEQFDPLSKEDLQIRFKNCAEWISSLPNKYFLLLCREEHDYTIFYLRNRKLYELTCELENVLKSRGSIIDLEYSHGSRFFECWVRRPDNEIKMYAFFPCDDFVVEV